LNGFDSALHLGAFVAYIRETVYAFDDRRMALLVLKGNGVRL
jgi:hypothetical protein